MCGLQTSIAQPYSPLSLTGFHQTNASSKGKALHYDIISEGAPASSGLPFCRYPAADPSWEVWSPLHARRARKQLRSSATCYVQEIRHARGFPNHRAERCHMDMLGSATNNFTDNHRLLRSRAAVFNIHTNRGLRGTSDRSCLTTVTLINNDHDFSGLDSTGAEWGGTLVTALSSNP